MSKLNISSNLMLGKAELDKFQNFIFDNGFVKSLLNNTVRFGIVYNTVDSSQTNYFDSFKVEQGTNNGTIKVNPGVGVDSDGRFITINNLLDNISIPDDGSYYWIKIAYKYTNIEKGTVSVDANGNLLGNGTEFTKIFRGQPNFPTRIKFVDSSLNIQEYDILSVTSDNVALLNVATINAESNLKFKIVGTFTPGQVPSESEKYPFQYDSCIEFSITKGIVEENNFNVRPNYTQNTEFYIARVKNNSGVMEIQDKRNEIWQPKADFEMRQLLYTENNCFGLESVMYDTLMGTNSNNFAVVGWGVRSVNWTLNHSNRIVSLLSCEGGKYRSTADFSNGSFDYWRIYTASGKQLKILNSTKNGTQIDLYVDKLDPDDFPNGQIVIVPDAEEIELIFKTVRLNAGSGSPVIPGAQSIENNKSVTFPISDAFARVPLAIWDYFNPQENYNQSGYNLTFRYKSFKTYSQIFTLSSAYDYFIESAFNREGEKINNDKRTSNSGSFTIYHNPQAYYYFKTNVYLGDKYCVTHLAPSNDNPVTDLQVGSNCQYQVFEGEDIMGVSQYVNLKTTNAVPGNKFYLNFKTNLINPANDYTFAIVQDFVNSGNVGTILYTFTDWDFLKCRQQNLLFHCEFDGNKWIVFKVIADEPTNPVTKNQIVFTGTTPEPFTIHGTSETHRVIEHNQSLQNYMIGGYLVCDPQVGENATPRGAYWFILSQDPNQFVVRFQNGFNAEDNTKFRFNYYLISLD